VLEFIYWLTIIYSIIAAILWYLLATGKLSVQPWRLRSFKIVGIAAYSWYYLLHPLSTRDLFTLAWLVLFLIRCKNRKTAQPSGKHKKMK